LELSGVRLLLTTRYNAESAPIGGADFDDPANLGGSHGAHSQTLDSRWAAIRDRFEVDGWPLVRLKQVHGNTVVTNALPSGHPPVEAKRGPIEVGEADAIVVDEPGVIGMIRTADCGAVALVGSRAVAIVHAGWKGLASGVLEAAASSLADAGTKATHAVIGAHIRPCCYEFGQDDLDRVAAKVGDEVRSHTRGGAPALDLGAGIEAVCRTLNVEVAYHEPTCTGCSERYFSHRTRRDVGRHGILACVR